jgi:putative metallohydrolase (TIGR04338 family)
VKTTTQGVTQQYELYATEVGLDEGRDLTYESAQEYVDAMRETEWWDRLYPSIMRVEVGRKRKNGRESVGWYEPAMGAGRIEMLPQHLNQLIIAHELSHVFAVARWNSQSHDPAFARVYLETVYHTMGSDAYLALKNAFDVGGIDYA